MDPFSVGKARSFSILLAFLMSISCSISPQAKEARFLKRGQTYADKKDFQRAALEFKNAISVQPKDAEAHYQLALVYLSAGDVPRAANELRTATQLNPKHAGAQMKLAELMASTQDKKLIQEAVSRIQSVFGTSPDNAEATDTLALAEWKLGRPEAAFERLEEELKKFPTRLQSSVNLARLSLSVKDPKKAEEVLNQAVVAAPKSSQAALALGELYELIGQPEKAEPEVRRAVQLDPKSGPALLTLGSILLAQKHQDEAGDAFKRLATLPDKAYQPVYAEFLFKIGKPEAGIAELQRLAKSDPNNTQVRMLLVSAYLNLNKTSEAQGLLDAALKRNPKDTDALLRRGDAQSKAGKGR